MGWKPTMSPVKRFLVTAIYLSGVTFAMHGQFHQGFDRQTASENTTPEGWSIATGDGDATMQFVLDDGYASILVNATKDTQNIWWALIRTPVQGIDISKLMKDEFELRVETRIRTSHAPR